MQLSICTLFPEIAESLLPCSACDKKTVPNTPVQLLNMRADGCYTYVTVYGNRNELAKYLLMRRLLLPYTLMIVEVQFQFGIVHNFIL